VHPSHSLYRNLDRDTAPSAPFRQGALASTTIQGGPGDPWVLAYSLPTAAPPSLAVPAGPGWVGVSFLGQGVVGVAFTNAFEATLLP
jgi:hypothetical protein